MTPPPAEAPEEPVAPASAVAPEGPGERRSPGVADAPREALTVRFWGTRGSIASPGPETAVYGGNTPCLEVRHGSRRVLFDAGTGIRVLGRRLVEEGDEVEATVFLTHFHWDHIQGFPFFSPLYDPSSRLRIFGPRQGEMDVETLFAGQLGPIYFPIPYSALAGHLEFGHLNQGVWEEDGVRIRALRVRHPSYTVGYRVEAGGRSFCYVPDNELVGGDYAWADDGWPDRMREFVEGVDLLVHDAMFTDAEYGPREGWGHSTYSQTSALAREAEVRRLLFFHHAPERTDTELDAILDTAREESEAAGSRVEIAAASEGIEFVI